MVIFKNTPDIKNINVNTPEIKSKKRIIKRINYNKKKNRKIAKSLYKNIPQYKEYYKIIKYNEKHINDKKLLKKEPLKFVKINNSTNTIYKSDIEKIKYKLITNKNKINLYISHKQSDNIIKTKKEFIKKNNFYKIRYDIKVYILKYVRNFVDDI